MLLACALMRVDNMPTFYKFRGWMMGRLAILPVFLLFILFAAPAFGALSLEAPEKVARGDAFLAKAFSDKPLETFTFYWRGRNHSVAAEPDGNGGSTASILLPAPLDEKSARLRLGVAAGSKGPGDVGAEVTFFDRKRPTQKLTVDRKYVSPPASEKARIERDREKVRKTLAASDSGKKWELPFKRPVPGTVSSDFGLKRVFNGEPRSVHRGLDLRGPEGSPIYACADGRVALVDNLYYSGNTVYVDHGDGVFTAYLHMSQPKVEPGQIIRKGDLVGLVGSTGRVTGPHLHLSLIVQGQSVDPAPLLEERAKGKAHE